VTHIAIYHLSIKIITRGKGKSAVAAAAYRSGETLHNEYDGATHDYTRKRGIVHTEILLPENAPAEYANRSALWNAVEKAERYKTAQLAREIEIALPVELTREQQISLARRYVQETFVSAGMCADICLHDTGKGNPHIHVMLTMRPIEKDGIFGAKSRTVNGRKINTTDWNDRTKAEHWRRAWAAYANDALRLADKLTEDNTLDHRSYERQGVDRIPTVHMGVAAAQMERRDIRTERGDINREIEITKSMLLQIKRRLDKLNKWLDEAKQNTAPTLADVLSEMLSGNRERSRWQQIRDLQMAAKTLVFIQEHKLTTIEDLRGKVSDFYDERQAMSDKLKPFERRIKTLDEHLRHSDNFTKYRKIAVKRDTLLAEAHKLDTQSLIFKGKAKEALKKAEDYDWKHLNALQAYDEAEKYLRGVLQKRFDPKNIPVAKWRQERETLAREKGGLNTEYAVLKDRIAEVEHIRKYAEEVQRTINPLHKAKSHDMSL
jgi:Lon protease-like protein